MSADYITQPPAAETAIEYAQKVQSGNGIACKYVQKACERFLNDLRDQDSKPFYFDEDAAQHAVDFFGFLRHTKGVWAKKRETSAFILAPWQVFILANLFGWLRRDNGERRFREAHLEVARKNGKSTFIAGIGLYMVFADGEPGAEVYSAACTKEQARIVFNAAKDMVKVSPFLSSRIGTWRNNLHIDSSSSKFEPLASDSGTLDGLNIHCGLIDELHEHPDRTLYDVLNTATGSRSQPLIISITTAGFNREGICWDQRTYGVKIMLGIIPDDHFFVFIATLDDGDNWEDESVWAKANPNLGVSVSLEAIRPNYIKAKEQPAALNEFLRKHLNVWTSSDTAYLSAGSWERNSVDEHADPKKLRAETLVRLKNRRGYGGLDVSEVEDLTALVYVFPPCQRLAKFEPDPKDKAKMIETVLVEADDKWVILPFFWIPEAYCDQRAKKNRAPYDAWVRSKFITITPGNTVDQEAIRAQALEIQNLCRVGEVGYDGWGAEWLGPKLLADGVKMIKIPQRFELLSQPTKSVSGFFNSGIVNHLNNPVLRWMFSNVQLLLDHSGGQRPDKGKSKNKIDGVVATVMAVGRALANPAGAKLDDPDRFKMRFI